MPTSFDLVPCNGSYCASPLASRYGPSYAQNFGLKEGWAYWASVSLPLLVVKHIYIYTYGTSCVCRASVLCVLSLMSD